MKHVYSPAFYTPEESRKARLATGVDPTLNGLWALQVYVPSTDTWTVWGRPRTKSWERGLMEQLPEGSRWRYRVDVPRWGPGAFSSKRPGNR